LLDRQIAFIFSITFDDGLIWEEKNSDPSIYIHGIVANPDFRGNKFVLKIAQWVQQYAKNIGKKFIRMDNWGDNQNLIDYYIETGFGFRGVVFPTKSADLPKYYEGISLSLFEIQVLD
jgi:hypothetical protein